jgi:hypothetical protein
VNKLLNLLVFSLLIVQCKAIDWYSDKNENLLKTNNTLFFKANSKKHADFMVALRDFKSSMIKRDFKSLYGLRTTLYREIVPFDNYKNNILGTTELPTRIYFSCDGSTIKKNTAIIKSFYVTTNKRFEQCYETTDYWFFDEKALKWFFVKNNLPWGTEVVLENKFK